MDDNKNILIREFEGWSAINTRHCLNFKVGEGIIALVSDREISELEILGIEYLVRDSSEIWKGLDLDICITKGHYNKETDFICNNVNNSKIINASKECLEHNKDMLENYKSIICIHYIAVPRYNKSSLWKFLNKRRCHVINDALDID